MTWEATIEHEYCPAALSTRSGFENAREALEFVQFELKLHTTNRAGSPSDALNIKIVIKETCLHDKQANWVRAARDFVEKTGKLSGYDTDTTTIPAYLCVANLLDKLATCAKCGEAVA